MGRSPRLPQHQQLPFARQLAGQVGVLNVGYGLPHAQGAPPLEPMQPDMHPYIRMQTPPTVQIQKAYVAKEWCLMERNISKEMKYFDGASTHYKQWNTRVRDHCQLVNQGWRRLLTLIEQEARPLNWAMLQQS